MAPLLKRCTITHDVAECTALYTRLQPKLVKIKAS